MPRKLLLFIESGGPGGAETVVLRLARALRARGLDAAVLTTRRGWLTESLADAGVPTFEIDAGRRLDVTFPVRIARLLRELRAEALHSHLLDSNFYGALAARIAGVPHIATEHGDVHHTEAKKFLRTKVRAISALGSRLTAVSQFTADRLAQLGARPERVTRIGNPVEPPAPLDEAERKALRARLGARDPAPVHWLWMHLANHRPVKDQATLLRGFAGALREAPAQTLCLIGDGPERPALEALARELGIAERTAFAGFRSDAARWLQAGDGFVLSSRSEALPMSLLEAAQAGLLPVCTEVGGVGEIVRSGETGVLVPPGAPEALARALGGAVRDVEGSARMARPARARVEARFGLDAVLDAYCALYER